MANEDYKNGKLVEIVREFNNTGNQYEVNGIKQAIAVPFWRRENDKFQVIPKGSYSFINEAGNDYLKILDSTILQQATQFQIVYDYLQLSSKYIEDFPDVVVLTEKYNQLVDDTTNLFSYLKSVGLVADTLQMTKVLSALEPLTTWYMDEKGEIRTLPVSDLYGKFQQMIDTLYAEIKNLLIKDKESMSTELKNETSKLLGSLNDLESNLSTNISKLSTEEIKKIIAEGKKQIELVTNAGSGLSPRVETLEKDKLDKGNVSVDYNSAEKIEDKIKDIIDNKWRLYPKEILNGTDLNNLTELGYYFNWSDGHDIKNAPETMKAFTLKVDSTSPSDPNYVHQTYKEVYSGEVYIRTRVNGNWNAWVRQATTPEVQAVENKLNNLKIKTAVLDVSKWCKLATVYMPRGASSVYINLATISGYNGETSQCFPAQIILRSDSGAEVGSENGDIGIGVIQYFKTRVWVKSVGYVKNGDYYDVYIKIGNTQFEMYPYSSNVAAFAVYSTEFEFKGEVFDNQPSNLVSEITRPNAISINHIPTISGGVLQGSQTDVILGFGKVYNPVWG